jgi:hypothetical protein
LTEDGGDGHKPKIWSVTDFLQPGVKGQGHPASCKETGMKLDTMRTVPTSAEAAAAAAVDLSGRTVPAGNGSLVSVAAAHAHAAALSRSAAAGGFLSPMTSLSHAQQMTYQSALASYAAHSAAPYSTFAGPALHAAASHDVTKLMKPTATRFSPYALTHPTAKQLDSAPFPLPPRDFSTLREGE